MSSFSANDLIFNSDDKLGIYTGGFSVNSIMMKTGISPIMTVNDGQIAGDSNKVSDLFTSELVVPNWAYSYDTKMNGGSKSKKKIDEEEEEDEVLDDELHAKLLELVKVHEDELKKNHKKTKKSIFHKNNKKGVTKKHKT